MIIIFRIFFSMGILLGLGALYYQRIDKIEFYKKYHREIQIFNKLGNIFYLPYYFTASKLERYDLIIEKKDLEFLNQNLPEGYAGNILTDKYKKSADAKLVSGGKEYRVKVRYRGDTDVHWRDPKKSWRIKFSDEDYFENTKILQLILPEDRDYLIEELNNYRSRKLGLVVPESKFVNLFVNGKRYGVYWQAEFFGKDMLEKQNVPGDVNLYGGVDFWEWPGGKFGFFENSHLWRKYSQDAFSPGDNYADLEAFLSAVHESSDGEFYAKLEDMVDMESLVRWIVVQDLVTSTHQSGFNMKAYFNPVKGKFVFIPWDVLYDEPPPAFHDYQFNEEFIGRLLQIPEFLHRRNALLWEYVSSEENRKDDLRRYDELDELTRNDLLKDTLKVESHWAYRNKIRRLRRVIEERFSYHKSNLKNADARVTVRLNNNTSGMRVEVGTQGYSSVVVKNIQLKAEKCAGEISAFEDSNKNSQYDSKDKKILSLGCSDGIYRGEINFLVHTKRARVDQYILRPALNNAEFFIVSRDFPLRKIFNDDALSFDIVNAFTQKKVKDMSVRLMDEAFNIDFGALNQSAEEFVRKNPSFRIREGNIFLPRGSYQLSQDIIIPKNTKLVLESGVKLFLHPGVSIDSRSPILAQGTERNPIIFQRAQEEPWGSIRVIDAKEKSIFYRVIISGGKEEYLNGVFSSGMLSVHHSMADITESEFRDARGDDALNIKYGFAAIQNNRFLGNAYDAIDLDVTPSLVEGNTFLRNGNDGIDISSSKPIIKNNVIEKSGDKCISVGERSSPIILNNLLLGCNIGIAAKDSSEPLIVNATAVNNTVGIDAYRKKNIFNGAHAKVYNSILWGNSASVKSDEISSVDIFSSVVQGGYAGENIFSTDPKLRIDFTADSRNPLNKIIDPKIYETLGPDFPSLEYIGYGKK